MKQVILSLFLLIFISCGEKSDSSNAESVNSDLEESSKETNDDNKSNDSESGDSQSTEKQDQEPQSRLERFGDADLDMKPEDFECIKNWTKVNNYYITNKLGYLDEAIAVAKSPDGGEFPPGTIIQLVPFEAMVKRKVGFDAATNDWEFFFLDALPSRTVIKMRGTTDVVNQFDGNCLDCHKKAEAKWDFICDKDHGCDPLPINRTAIELFQNADKRCSDN